MIAHAKQNARRLQCDALALAQWSRDPNRLLPAIADEVVGADEDDVPKYMCDGGKLCVILKEWKHHLPQPINRTTLQGSMPEAPCAMVAARSTTLERSSSSTGGLALVIVTL